MAAVMAGKEVDSLVALRETTMVVPKAADSGGGEVGSMVLWRVA